jgi:tripartite-type tricarboxylate transporter receptor subunit TctC
MNFKCGLVLCLLASFALSAMAQITTAWPARGPTKLVAVFPPGGSVDQVARMLAVPLQAALGQSVIVKNKAGACGCIGAAEVATAPADGYTFAVVSATHGVNPALISNLPFNSKKEPGAWATEGALAKIGPGDGQVFDDFAGEYLDIWQISGEK